MNVTNGSYTLVFDEDIPYAYLAIEDGQLTVLSEDEVPDTFSTTTDTDTTAATDSDTSTDNGSGVDSDTDTAADTDTTADTAGSSSYAASNSTSSANNSVSAAESTAVSSDTAQSGDARGVVFFLAAAVTALSVAVFMATLARKKSA